MSPMKSVSNHKCLVLILYFFGAVFLWSGVGSNEIHSTAYADQGQRAFLSEPEGLLKGNAKAKDAISLINWMLMVSCAVPATMFTIQSGKRFNDQEYGAAFGSAIGAVIAGLGGYIAFSFI